MRHSVVYSVGIKTYFSFHSFFPASLAKTSGIFPFFSEWLQHLGDFPEVIVVIFSIVPVYCFGAINHLLI